MPGSQGRRLAGQKGLLGRRGDAGCAGLRSWSPWLGHHLRFGGGMKPVERAACGQSTEDHGGRDAEFGPVLAALWRRGQMGSGTPVRRRPSPECCRDEET